MKHKICAFLLAITALCFYPVYAQLPDYKFRFAAKLVDADSITPIEKAHIINKTQNLGTISNAMGAFTITANVKDSLIFSVLGYATLIIAVHDSMYTNTRIIRLKPIAYNLREVQIGLLSTYNRFKRDIVSMESADPLSFTIDPISKFEVPQANQVGINLPGLGSPVTFLYNLWSKEGKAQRYYRSVIGRTAEYIIIGDKFNGEIVSQLTGLKEDELVQFMSSCMFSKEYLLLATPDEVNREVVRKYREYAARKKNQIP